MVGAEPHVEAVRDVGDPVDLLGSHVGSSRCVEFAAARDREGDTTVFGLFAIVYGITTLTLAAPTRRAAQRRPADPRRGPTTSGGRLPDQTRVAKPAAGRVGR
jgi:hypothetical protein